MTLTPAMGGRDRGSEDVLRTLLEQSVAGIFILDLDGRIVYLNAGFAEMFGAAPAEMIGRSYFDFVPGGEVEARRAGFDRLASGELPSRQVVAAFTRLDGETFEVLTESTLASYDGVPAIVGVAADVSARRRVERAFERANKAQLTLSAANSALMRAQSEDELLAEMCALALTTGAYATAWIGMAERDAEKTVRPAARAGDDTEFCAGPTVTAIRSRAPVVVRTGGAIVALPLLDGERADRCADAGVDRSGCVRRG